MINVALNKSEYFFETLEPWSSLADTRWRLVLAPPKMNHIYDTILLYVFDYWANQICSPPSTKELHAWARDTSIKFSNYINSDWGDILRFSSSFVRSFQLCSMNCNFGHWLITKARCHCYCTDALSKIGSKHTIVTKCQNLSKAVAALKKRHFSRVV